MRLRPLLLAGLVATLVAAAAGAARAESVQPIPPAECAQIRNTLENNVPIGPGFRTKEIDFPNNNLGITGRMCRLLAVGTGVHIEGERIRTIDDVAAYISHALKSAGFYETNDTRRFTSKGQHGRKVFALYRDGVICVSTIQVGMVEGAKPPPGAVENGTIYLGELPPYEREWWIAVDCFRP